MPEGPELHLASLYVNRMCEGVIFAGAVEKSEVSKSPDVPFTCDAYRITATSRGKEVKLTLMPMKTDDTKQKKKARQADQPMDIVFRFGMSGFFRLSTEEDVPKHSHLRFFTKEKPCRVLSFVDVRRFGSWQPNGTWQPSRGPCIMFEYKSFRENVLSHLSNSAFDKPICETLLNQKYFNGIGNYLRAEILFRLNIPPFVPARSVLEGLESDDFCENEKPVKNENGDKKQKSDRPKKTIVKEETGDLLRLCHTVPLEVVNLGGKGYDPQKEDYSDFEAWLRCYYVDGMKSIRDSNGRTMWFKGDPGPMVPKDAKSPKKRTLAKKEDDHDYTVKKKATKSGSAGTRKRAASTKQETVTKTSKEEKDVGTGAGSKRRKTKKNRETKSPQHRKTPAARKGSTEPTTSGEVEGTQTRSGRVTRQSSK